MAELIFWKSGEAQLRVELVCSRHLSVGRSSHCDVILPDATIPDEAFEVTWNGHGDFHVRPSTQGVTLLECANGVESPLKSGNEINLGAWRVQLVDEAKSGARLKSLGVKNQLQVVGPSLSTAHQSHQAVRHVACPDRLTIGSASSCDLVLSHPSVASMHGIIETRGGLRWIRDLNSKSGTFVSGARIWAMELLPDVPVQMGPFQLTLMSASNGVEPHRGTFTRPKPSKKSGAFQGIVGNSPLMQQVFHVLTRVSASDATVLVMGESGTGKELVARAIHERSDRSKGPFVPINCGALSEHLVESELFGHEKGAFTGADRPRKGAFEEATGGTLFLDEIGELPLAMQAKLLRALELFEVKRVGSSKSTQVDVRVVCATNRDLRREVTLGHFREDLYWRLAALQVRLPPLRQRGKQDVLALVDFFLQSQTSQFSGVQFTQAALDALAAHPWPGNVRELKHCMVRTLLLRSSDVIDVKDLRFDDSSAVNEPRFNTSPLRLLPPPAPDDVGLQDDAAMPLKGEFSEGGDDAGKVVGFQSMDRTSDGEFHRVCDQMGYCVSAIARTMGTSRGTIYRRMHRLGLKGRSVKATAKCQASEATFEESDRDSVLMAARKRAS